MKRSSSGKNTEYELENNKKIMGPGSSEADGSRLISILFELRCLPCYIHGRVGSGIGKEKSPINKLFKYHHLSTNRAFSAQNEN